MDRAIPEREPRAIPERDQRGKFMPGNSGSAGRPRGSKDRLTRTLKECVLMAGEIVGSDGRGKDGLLGYLTRVARTDPKTYVALLGRLMPIDLRSTTEPVVTYRSVEEVQAELAARGITPDYMHLMAESMAKRAARANGGNGTLNGGDGVLN